jgi:hypothetical protein
MATVENPPKLPGPNIPVIDLKTGRISDVWYQYFRQLDDKTRKLIALS